MSQEQKKTNGVFIDQARLTATSVIINNDVADLLKQVAQLDADFNEQAFTDETEESEIVAWAEDVLTAVLDAASKDLEGNDKLIAEQSATIAFSRCLSLLAHMYQFPIPEKYAKIDHLLLSAIQHISHSQQEQVAAEVQNDNVDKMLGKKDAE